MTDRSVYLVTGAAGFIGSHIVEELLSQENTEVIGIDNFYSGTQDNIDFLEGLSNNNFTFIEADIRDSKTLFDIFKEYHVEYVFHHAAIASVQKSIEEPLFTNAVNVTGTLNILEAARHNNAKKIVFASSAAIYGDEPTLPKNETSVIRPLSPYGYEKYMGEHYLKLYANLYGLNTVALRYFNVYGPRQDPSSEYSGIISIFDNKIKANQAVTIFGDGEQYRDFIYVKDAIQANMNAMHTTTEPFDVFCVGTSVKTSVNDVFNVISEKHKQEKNLSYCDARKGDIKKSLADNSKLCDILNVNIENSFAENIHKF
jgi:UDP-glucose 4-epimerase